MLGDHKRDFKGQSHTSQTRKNGHEAERDSLLLLLRQKHNTHGILGEKTTGPDNSVETREKNV